MVIWFFAKTKNATFWIMTLCVTFSYISLLLYIENKRYDCFEPFPAILEVSPQTKRIATKVQVGMHVKTFPQFSITTGLFVMDAVIWFKFAASTENIETLTNFTIQNSQLLDSEGMMHKSRPMVKLVDDDVLVAFNIQVKFMSSLEYKKFPLGNHRLNITLVNETITPQELVFVSANEHVTLSKDIMVDDWKPVATHAKTGYCSFGLTQDPALALNSPCAVFSIDFNQVGYRSLTSLYFPLFVLFLIGLLSMMINIFDLTRLGMISASLPMLVLYRLVIDANSPPVAYATNIDFVFYSLVMLSIPILIVQMYVALEGKKISQNNDEVEKKEAGEFLERINNVAFILILFALVLLMTYNFLR